MVSNYNVNSSYTFKKLKKCKNKWILCQKSKIYNKTFKILSIGKVFIKSTNSKMIFFISKIPLKLLDWFRIWKTCVNHTLAHREIFNKNCDSSIPQNKTKISTIIEYYVIPQWTYTINMKNKYPNKQETYRIQGNIRLLLWLLHSPLETVNSGQIFN